jgi:hypothetical protein
MMLVEKARSCELNFFIPWPVYHLLMKAPISKWENICLDAFAVVESHLKNIVKESSVRVCQHFPRLASAVEYLAILILYLTNNIGRRP